VYLCTISRLSHLPKSLMVNTSSPCFLSKQAKVLLKVLGLQDRPVFTLSFRSIQTIPFSLMSHRRPSPLCRASHFLRSLSVTADMLVDGYSRLTCCLYYCVALPAGFYPLTQDEAGSSAPGLTGKVSPVATNKGWLLPLTSGRIRNNTNIKANAATEDFCHLYLSGRNTCLLR